MTTLMDELTPIEEAAAQVLRIERTDHRIGPLLIRVTSVSIRCPHCDRVVAFDYPETTKLSEPEPPETTQV
jgi:hypothetical protein